jgi:hypothetical protein
MKLQIVGLIDRGKAASERLYLRALADANLSFYIVFDTTYTSPNSISNEQRHTYWFPPTQVKAGDHVILYTGSGQRSVNRNPDGTTSHFFYWGLGNTIWNVTGDCAVLFEVNTWQTSNFE